MRLDIIDNNGQATARVCLRSWRDHAVLSRHAVQPDDLAIGENLAVHDVTFIVSINPTGPKPESVDQEVVASLDVLIDEECDDPLRVEHAISLTGGAIAVLENVTSRSARTHRVSAMQTMPSTAPIAKTTAHGLLLGLLLRSPLGPQASVRRRRGHARRERTATEPRAARTA
jgi:hypothetical protein